MPILESLQGSLQTVTNGLIENYNADYGLYGEYGITDKLNVVAVLPFKAVSTLGVTDSTDFSEVLLDSGSITGLSNITLAIKYGLIDDRWKLAVSGQVKINSSSVNSDLGLATGFQANAYGVILHGGGGIGKKGYGFADLGFNVYDNGFSETFEGQLEYGYALKERLYVGANMGYRISMQNGTFNDGNLLQTGLYSSDQEYVAVSLKASYEMKSGLGFNFATPIAPIYFNNIGFNGTLAFGVFYKW